MFNDKKIHKKVCITFAVALVVISILSYFTVTFPVQTGIFMACMLGLVILGMVYFAVYMSYASNY